MKLNLKDWVAKITGQTEFKTLLWTGSSDSTQAPTTFPVNDYYNAIDVYFRGNGRPMVPMRVERSMGSRTCNIAWANYFAYRVIGFDGSQVTIGSGGYYSAYNSGSAINGDSYAVPYKIYGVKYVGGVVRKLLNALKMLTSERGWAV